MKSFVELLIFQTQVGGKSFDLVQFFLDLLVDFCRLVYVRKHSKDVDIVSHSDLGKSLVIFLAHILFHFDVWEEIRAFNDSSKDIWVGSQGSCFYDFDSWNFVA
jgi:hypothetical protein